MESFSKGEREVQQLIYTCAKYMHDNFEFQIFAKN